MTKHRVRYVRVVAVIAVTLGVLGLGAGPASAQSDVDDPAQLDAGLEAYGAYCAGCHGADGAGTAAGRPLTDIALQQPDRLVHVESVTNGKGGMPNMNSVASDEEIDAAVTYVRLTFITAQADDGADEELPATGSSTDSLLWIGLALVAVGGAAMILARPRPATE